MWTHPSGGSCGPPSGYNETSEELEERHKTAEQKARRLLKYHIICYTFLMKIISNDWEISWMGLY